MKKNRLLLLFFLNIIASCNKNPNPTPSPTNTPLPKLATLYTNSIDSVALDFAICDGYISDDGGAKVISRGFCWSTNPEPTYSNSKIEIGLDTGQFTGKISNLVLNTTYYVRAFAMNMAGISYGKQLSFKTGMPNIGLSYQGGVIAYVDFTGSHGFIAAPINQNYDATSKKYVGVYWGCSSKLITGAIGKVIGSGKTNTEDFIKGCNETSLAKLANPAARICYDLILNGYNDWYLPSIYELNQMYLNKTQIGNFVDDISSIYWSSSQTSTTTALTLRFTDGVYIEYLKSYSYNIRAIRNF